MSGGPYGLTSTGFVPKSAAHILADLQANQLATVASNLDVSPGGTVGRLNAPVVAALDSLWQLCADIYQSRNRANATNAALDDVGAITGTPREPATFGTVLLTCNVGFGGTLPKGSVAGVPGNQRSVWITNETVTNTSLLSPNVSVQATCAFAGAVPATAGTITKILTPVQGWASAMNGADAIPGVDAEDDPHYRARQVEELGQQGETTPAALAARILDMVNSDGSQCAAACIVETNSTNFTDALGRPPHTIEVVVQWTAGTISGFLTAARQQLASLIWTQGKAAGIATFSGGGGVAGGTLQFLEVLDTAGVEHGIYWTEPSYVDVYVSVTLTPSTAYIGDSAVALAIENYGATLAMGATVYASQFESIVMAPTVTYVDSVATAVTPSGVVDVSSLFIGLASSPTTSSRLEMSARSVPVFDGSRITVTS